jgi:uncharacterized membrane protein YbaN (DUF454 family)
MKRIILNILGFLALAVGAIGVVLPLLPTTPFVLCAAGCFSAANPAMYRWLVKTRYFGEYIRNFREKTGVSTGTRVRALIFLWAALIISGAIVRRPLVLVVLAVVGVGVSIHLLLLRRAKPPDASASPVPDSHGNDSSD